MVAWRVSFLSLLYFVAWCPDVEGVENVSCPETEERVCDFPIIDGSNFHWKEFEEHFMNANRPILIQNAAVGWPSFEAWRWDSVAETFGETRFRVGPGPYPTDQMTMSEYIQMCDTLIEKRKTHPKTEIPGIFQYGQVPTSWTLWAHKKECVPAMAYFQAESNPLHHNTSFVCNGIMSMINVPKFLVGEEDEISPAQITHSGFLAGFKGSGIDFHKHQDAINVIFHGKKQWYMKVPKSVVQGYKHIKGTAQSNPDWKPSATSLGRRGSLSKILNARHMTEEHEANTMVLQCEQMAGEIVYIPNNIQHGVLNLEPTIAMQMQWNRLDWNSFHARNVYKKYLLHILDPSIPDVSRPNLPPGAGQISEGERRFRS